MKALKHLTGRARGLGSPKSGSDHWWAQRVTALAMIPLSIWFVAHLLTMPLNDFAGVTDWLESTMAAGLALLLFLSATYHAALGMQVVIEDYVHHEGLKVASILIMKGAYVVAAVVATLSILKIYFLGS